MFTRSYFAWAKQILKAPIVDRRFIILSPPHAKNVVIYDRKQRKKLFLQSRNAHDWATIWQIFYDQFYSIPQKYHGSHVRRLYESLLTAQRRPFILDCGANIGASAVFFKAVFPAAQLICVEPDSGNACLATKNLGDRGGVLQCAVGPTNSIGRLQTDGLACNGYQVVTDVNGSLPILSVKTICDRNLEKFDVPFLIKIDIEGFESQLFRENYESIFQFPILFIELHDWLFPNTQCSHSFFKALLQTDRNIFPTADGILTISRSVFEMTKRTD